jgi:hypothetical protein
MVKKSMKFTLKAIFAILILASTTFGCDSTEGFVTKEEGLWKISNLNTKTFENDILKSDITQDDSLGQMLFTRKGGGVITDFAGTPEDFVWSYSKRDDRLTIYWKVGPYAVCEVKSKSESSMTLFWINGEAIRIESTMKLDRL